MTRLKDAPQMLIEERVRQFLNDCLAKQKAKESKVEVCVDAEDPTVLRARIPIPVEDEEELDNGTDGDV